MKGVINGKTRICNAGKGRHDERKATVEWKPGNLESWTGLPMMQTG